MKITLSRKQWQGIGKKAGWFSGDENKPAPKNPPPKCKVHNVDMFMEARVGSTEFYKCPQCDRKEQVQVPKAPKGI